jgi:diguanylate cyclase (GGDEF)-like protein
MIETVTCMVEQHDLRLVLLAAAMCIGGAVSVVQLFSRALIGQGLTRHGWHLLGAVTLGSAVWCTHFIAMLAHRPGVPVSFDPVLTIVSLLVPILGALPGLMLAGAAPAGGGLLLPASGGAIIGGAIGAMHFAGMLAYRVDGIVIWRPGFVAAAVGLAVILAALAFCLAAERRDGRVRPAAVGAFVLAVLSLHFTGMAGVQITPLGPASAGMAAETFGAMALSIAAAGLLVITTGVFAHMMDRAAQRNQAAQLALLAMTDALTGLANRAAFRDRLDKAITHAGDTDGPLAVIAIDLAGFKRLNETAGHEAGDMALRVMAQRLAIALGPHGTLARLGNDDFAAFLPCPSRAALGRTIAALEAAAAQPLELGPAPLALGAHFGIACFPDDGTSRDALTGNAELALARAKASGVACHCFYDAELDEAARERRVLADALKEAIGEGALALHFQLQASVSGGDITGYEALLRWTHPTRGRIPPSLFVPIAEEAGLVGALGAWALRRACADAARWRMPWRVAVNLSPLQLADPALPALIRDTLAETGLPAARLEIELTETAIIEDEARALATLRAIKALGVGVALDDFGTGYSSLKTLRSFPFDKIKLDRFFMAEIETSAASKALLRSVLALGKSLGIPVLAEGVETPAQLAILRQEGCDEAQGYLLGRPGPLVARAQPQHEAERRAA